MRYFCITHQPLPWPVPAFMEPVSTTPAGDGVSDLSERYPELAGLGPELSEYATLFALRRLLQESWGGNTPPDDQRMIGIAHYRRFAVRRPLGASSDIYGVLSPADFATLDDDVFLPAAGELVMPAPMRFPAPVLAQYGSAHVARDLLHFMGIAIDLGVVEGEAVAGFLSGPVLVAAPTVGVWPGQWLVLVLEALEAVVERFQSTVGVLREGYQRRAAGFCSERLHSLLALQLAASWDTDLVTANRLLLVSEDSGYRIGD